MPGHSSEEDLQLTPQVNGSPVQYKEIGENLDNALGHTGSNAREDAADYEQLEALSQDEIGVAMSLVENLREIIAEIERMVNGLFDKNT